MTVTIAHQRPATRRRAVIVFGPSHVLGSLVVVPRQSSLPTLAAAVLALENGGNCRRSRSSVACGAWDPEVGGMADPHSLLSLCRSRAPATVSTASDVFQAEFVGQSSPLEGAVLVRRFAAVLRVCVGFPPLRPASARERWSRDFSRFRKGEAALLTHALPHPKPLRLIVGPDSLLRSIATPVLTAIAIKRHSEEAQNGHK